MYWSQAARQGLAVLMASASVVLKHETSPLRQIHNFISIDLTFGVGNYVKEDTSPAKFGSDPMSVRDTTWGNIYGSCDFFIYFFILNRATAHTNEPIFAHNSSKDAVWYKKNPFLWREVCGCEIRGCFTQKNTPKLGRNRQLTVKIKCWITSKR